MFRHLNRDGINWYPGLPGQCQEYVYIDEFEAKMPRIVMDKWAQWSSRVMFFDHPRNGKTCISARIAEMFLAGSL